MKKDCQPTQRITGPTLFFSGVLEETVVVVPDGYDLERLPEDLLGLVIYRVGEMNRLALRRVDPATLRQVHLVKQGRETGLQDGEALVALVTDVFVGENVTDGPTDADAQEAAVQAECERLRKWAQQPLPTDWMARYNKRAG